MTAAPIANPNAASASVAPISGYTAGTLAVDMVVSRGALFPSKPVTSSDLHDAIGRSPEPRPMPEGVS